MFKFIEDFIKCLLVAGLSLAGIAALVFVLNAIAAFMLSY